MKYIKRFNESRINEGAGLILGGVILGAMALPGLFSWAKHSFTKWMMEKRFKPTGKVEMIPFKEDEIKFEEVSDKESGKLFWGVTFVDKTIADPGYENEQYFLFDQDGFDKLKQEMSKGEFKTSGAVKSWSKTPGNVSSDEHIHGL